MTTILESSQLLFKRIEPFKRIAWLPVIETRAGTVLNSKFSGIPLLNKDENWPCCKHCQQEMQLFLQLNSNDLPKEAQAVFGGGILQVFYCTNYEQECEIQCEAFFPFAKSTLLRIVDANQIHAKTLSASPVIDAFEEKVIVSWQAIDDYPNYEELSELEEIELTDDEIDMLSKDYPKAGDKLLGWPAWVQGVEYPDCPDCGERMNYIFQIDSENNLPYMFGDVGCAHITQCEKHRYQLAIAWACC